MGLKVPTLHEMFLPLYDYHCGWYKEGISHDGGHFKITTKNKKIVKLERRNRAELIELFKMIKGLSSTHWSHFFKKAKDTSARRHTW